MAGELQTIRERLEARELNDAIRLTLDWFGESAPLTLAATLGGGLRTLIDKGQADTISAYLKGLASFVEADTISAIRRALDEARAEMGDWGQRLLPVTQERLCRECRDAIRLQLYDLALLRSRQILALPVGGQSLGQRCQLLGTVLGSLENLPKETETLWKMIQKEWSGWRMNEHHRQIVLDTRQSRLDSVYQRRYETTESEWTRQLTDLALALRGELPPRDKLGAATPEEVETFLAAARGLVQGGVDSPKQIAMPDVLWVLVEFTPREQTATATRAGIEQRVYNALGPRGQQVVDQAMARLHTVEPFRAAVLDAGLRPPFDRYLDMALDLMGSVGWEGFADFARGVLHDKRKLPHHPAAIRAIGSCGGERSLDLLVDVFKSCCKGRVVDGHERRTAIKVLNAMSRVIRRNDLTGPPRDKLVKRVIDMIPSADSRLRLGVAARLCLHRPETLAPNILDWAIQRFMENLWRPDDTPDLGRPTDAEEIKRKPLGQRQGVVDALSRIGAPALKDVHQFVMGEENVNGAYVAVAEVLERIADPSSVGVLETMLRRSLLVDEAEFKKKYSQEMVFDSEAGQMVYLNRDALVGAICHALLKINSPESIEVLHRLKQQTEAGRAGRAGKVTAGILTRLPDRPAGMADRPISQGGLTPTPVEEEGSHTAELLQDLKPTGLLSGAKGRQRRVAAMAQLSRRLEPQALLPMLELLSDRDAMVAASAKTALLHYAGASAPARLREQFADLAFAELDNPKCKAKQALIELLGEVDTTQEPWASRIETLMQTNPTGALRAGLARLSRLAGADLMAQKEETAQEPEMTKEAVDRFTALESKRAYFEARQAWIAGGKQGPPPERPPGA
jgi:hypothetical protein